MWDAASPEHETCQTCHMPEPDLDGDTIPDPAYACFNATQLRGRATTYEGPMRTHEFAGANAWMLGVLRDEIGADLGREAQLDAGVRATLEMLTRRTVVLDVSAPAAATAGDFLPLAVRITNLAGHKFPTGYAEGRRAWIHVSAGIDADSDGLLSAGEVQHESGAWDPSTGQLARDAQIKVYEAKLGV